VRWFDDKHLVAIDLRMRVQKMQSRSSFRIGADPVLLPQRAQSLYKDLGAVL
jgi:hypothetical protein